MRVLDDGKYKYTENLQAKQWLAFSVGFLWEQQQQYTGVERQYCSKNENTLKSTAFWLSVWKKWCLQKGIAEEIDT